MHMALIISSLQSGGAERVISNLANAWVDKGYNVSLITLAPAHEKPAYALDSRIRLVQLNQMTPQGISLFGRVVNGFKRIFKVRSAIRAVQPDIILSFITIINIVALLSTRFLGIPVVVAERTHPAFHQSPLFHRILRWITYSWAGKVISQTISASDCFHFLRKGKKVVIPNAVKIPSRKKSNDDLLKPVRQIISVGRLCPNKGFQVLISAFSRIASQYPDLMLTIYGEGEMRKNLEKLIEDLDLANRVKLPGAVRNVEGALYQADLFVFPSLYEGFPNALCEAMAIGLPVIASKCSGTVDIVTDGVDGRLFDVGDSDQLTELLEEMMENPIERLSLSKEARKVVDRFSGSTVLQKWDEVLLEVRKR